MAAANATIDIFEKENVISHNHKIGAALIHGCQEAILKAGASHLVEVVPCNWLVVFNFKDKDGIVSAPMRTLAMQEMIKRGILFQGAFVPCFSHTFDDINYFIRAFSETLTIIKSASNKGLDTFLIGEIVKPVFRKRI